MIYRADDTVTPSSNFAFLSYFGPTLVEAAARAELVIALDPVGALNHLRLFGEALAQAAVARLGLGESRQEKQIDRLRALENKGVSNSVLQLFHTLLTVGNRASHEGMGTQEDAFTQLKIAWQLAVWFQRAFGSNRKFEPGPFVPPRDLKAETESLRAELEALRAVAATSQTQIEQARAEAQAEARKALGVREAEQRALEEREFWESLARETEAARNADRQALLEAQQALEAQRARYEAELVALQARAQQQTPAEQQQQLERTVQAAAKVNLDEASTRAIIDEQLRAAGWEANTQELRFGRGTRPEKGRQLAIAEWPPQRRSGRSRAEQALRVGVYCEARRTAGGRPLGQVSRTIPVCHQRAPVPKATRDQEWDLVSRCSAWREPRDSAVTFLRERGR